MRKNRVLFVMVCLGLLMVLGLRSNAVATAQSATGDVVFKTPEDAIAAFMQGVAQGDVDKILQTCAISEMSEKIHFDQFTARIGVLQPFQSEAPSEYPFYTAMNKFQLSAQILNQVKIFAFSLLSTEAIASGAVIPIDAPRTAQFIKAVDPARLTTVTVKKIGTPNPTNMNSPKYQDSEAKQAQIYGADELTERVVLFAFEGSDYVLGFTTIRYGDSWKVARASSPMSNMNSVGAPVKITESDFNNLTK